MPYTAYATATVGQILTANFWNQQVRDNGLLGPEALATADGEVWIATAANAGEMVAILDASNQLKPLYGGAGIDLSGVVLGGSIAGSGSGTFGINTLMTQAQAEAGTDTVGRLVAALQVKQAIDVLAPTSKHKTGTYTGDGATSQGITGIGFQPIFVWITKRVTSEGAFSDREVIFTTDQIVDDNGSGGAITIHETAGNTSTAFDANAIISLDADGFTVDDNGADADPNTNSQVYNYFAIG